MHELHWVGLFLLPLFFFCWFVTYHVCLLFFCLLFFLHELLLVCQRNKSWIYGFTKSARWWLIRKAKLRCRQQRDKLDYKFAFGSGGWRFHFVIFWFRTIWSISIKTLSLSLSCMFQNVSHSCFDEARSRVGISWIGLTLKPDLHGWQIE